MDVYINVYIFTHPYVTIIINNTMNVWIYYRRKFRSQTSDNMERWKAEKRRVEERKKKSKKEDRRKKIEVGEMLGKSRNIAFFRWFVGGLGWKVGSLERPLLEVGMWKNVTPLWREAPFQANMLKTRGLRPLFEARRSKHCTPQWREAHFQVTIPKAHKFWTIFGNSDVQSMSNKWDR